MAVNVFQNTLGNSDWNNALNWSLLHVPQAGDDISIAVGQTPTILNNSAGSLVGTVTNAGTLRLSSGGNLTDLIVGTGGTVTLTGGGVLQLSDNGANRIYSNTASSILDNINNTIQGGGEIFSGSLSLINEAAGIVNANAAATMLSIHDIGITNKGLIEATAGGAGLRLQNVTLTQTGSGRLVASGAGSHVDLYAATVTGGDLTTVNGGLLQSVTSATLDGSTAGGAIHITAASTFTIANSAGMTLTGTAAAAGTVNNQGVIALQSAGNFTDLIVGTGGTVHLTGGGTIQMSDNGANRIYSGTGSSVLDNVNNTISGAGQIMSSNNLSITNQTAGVINASAAANQLILLSLAITNKGLIEATGAAGLAVRSTTITGAAGTLKAATGSHVDLASSTIQGGTLTTVGSGVIQAVDGGSALDGSTGAGAIHIAVASALAIANSALLTLAAGTGTPSSIDNKGTVGLQSVGNFTDLMIGTGGTVQLSGGGLVQLSDNSANRIYSNTAGSVLDNIDNTIAGAGQIFANVGLSLINETAGVINASAANNQIVIRSITVTNKGLIEATGAAGMTIQSATITQSAGTLKAATGSLINLQSATIQGGTLTSVGSGVIQTVDGNSVLDGTSAAGAVHITTGSKIALLNANALTLVAATGVTATIENKGTVAFQSTGNFTDLIVGTGGTIQLTGGGTLQMSDNSANRIYGNTSGSVLDNIDNTITGAGQIFANAGLSLTNEAAGVIDASATSNQIVIRNITVTNKGLIQATGAAGLTVQSATITGSAGTLKAATGSLIDLQSATIEGGTLATAGTGVIQTVDNNSVFDGTSSAGAIHIAAGSNLALLNGTTLTLTAGSGATSTIENKGTIALNAAGSYTDLLVGTGGTVQLTGGGTVQLSDNSTNRVYSNASGSLLDNIDNTIVGAGQIFANSGLSMINESQGTIEANSPNNNLIVRDIAITNNGTLRARNGATLSVGGLTNLAADPAFSGGDVLTGGVYDVVDPVTGGLGSGGASIIALTQNALAITTLAATVNLAGATSTLTANGTALSASLRVIAGAGTLNLYAGSNSGTQQVFTDPNALEVDGGVNLDGASVSVQSLAVTATGAIAGAGLVGTSASAFVNDGFVASAAAAQSTTLEIASAVTGTGTFRIGKASTLQIDSTTSGAVSVGGGLTFAFEAGTTPAQGATLRLQGNAITASSFGALITGFQAQDTINLAGLTGLTVQSFDGTTLTLKTGGGVLETLKFAGIRAQHAFTVQADTTSGVDIRLGAPVVSVSTTGKLTNQTSQLIQGLADAVEAGTTVSFYDNGGSTPLATTTVGSNGAFSKTITISGDGTHSIVAKDVDALGQTGSATAVVFTLDTVAPTVTVSGGNVLVSQAARTVSGTVSDLHAGSTVSLYDNGGATPFGTGAVSGGAYSASVTLVQGDNLIVAKNTDGAGNTGASTAVDAAFVGASTTYANTRATSANGLVLQGSAVVQNTGTITQTGAVTIGDASGLVARIANATGGTYTIAGDLTIGVGTNTASNFNNNGGTLQKTSGTGVATLAAGFQNGSGAAAQIKIASGTLNFTGASNSLVNQAISGAGTFAIGGAGTSTIGAGTTIATAAWSIARAGTAVMLGTSLAYAGSFSDTNATALDLGANTLTLTGPATFSAGVAGKPRVTGTTGKLITSGADTISGLAIGGSALFRNNGSVSQSGTVTVGDGGGGAAQITNAAGATWSIIGDNVIAAGNAATTFNNGGGTLRKASGTGGSFVGVNVTNLSGLAAAIVIDSGTLGFTGASNSFLAETVSGAGTFSVAGGVSAVGAGTTINSAGWSIVNAGTTVNFGSSLTFGGGFVANDGVTLNLGSTTLTLNGAATFSPGPGGSPTLKGSGKVLTSGADTIGGLVIGGAVLFRNNGAVTQSGTVVVGDSSNGAAQITNAAGKTWSLANDVGINFGNAMALFNNGGGTLQKTAGAGTSVVGVNFTNLAAAASAVTINTGTLQFNGANNVFTADAISGAGTFAIGGGGTSAIGSGTTITTAAWTIAKAGTSVTLAQNLGFAGSFSATNATTLALGGNSLTLSGAAAFNLGPAGSPLVTGSGKLITSGADTIGGLALGGSTLFRNNGSVTQTGAVTLGDSSNGSAQITDAGSWAIAGDVGIVKGSTAAVFNTGGGTLTKTAGSGTSIIATALVNLNTATSKIEVASGTLDFAGAVSGANAFAIDAGRTLAFEASVATGSAVRFAGAGGTLLLNDAQDFKGSIAGFGANQTLDLGSIGYSSATTTLGFGGSTLTVSDGTRTASLAIGTGYSQASFHLASDTHGGSLVTYG